MENSSKKQSFWKEERGDISIKGIAITVAIIVVIGLALTFIQGNLGTWITEIWELFMTQIEGLIS